MRLSPPPPPPISLSWWTGKERSVSKLPRARPPPACIAATRVPPARPRCLLSLPARDTGTCGLAALQEAEGLDAGDPAAELSRFSPGSSLPVGRGRGQLSRRVKARQRGVQPGSGTLVGGACRPRLSRQPRECGPRPADYGRVFSARHHRCLSWRCQGRSQRMEGPACCRRDGWAHLCCPCHF